MQLWKKLRLILTIQCEHASRLTSEALERDLDWEERAALRAHILICNSCRHFEAQLSFLRDAFRKSGEREHADLDEGPQLNPEFKARLKQLPK
ncbi:MAG: hypothetical protein Aurels2KO_07270 [Aureliella sp.]